MEPLDPVEESAAGALADRVIAVFVVLTAAAFVFVLARIQPSPNGVGTHVQLGMTPCGWVQSYGIPCPTCGVTTAATHLVHLSPIEAVGTQPFGAGLAGFGLWMAGVAIYCLARRRSYFDYLLRLPQGRLVLLGLVLLLASWWYVYATFEP